MSNDKEEKKGGFVATFNKINEYLVSKSGVKVKDKANFFHLLAVMLNAGIPMIKAIRSLYGQLDKSPALSAVVKTLADDVEGGQSLSDAMIKHHHIFTEAEVGMIQSGEASGQLSNVLNNLSEDLDKAHMVRTKIKGAMMYPSFLFIALIMVIVAMMVGVVPKMMELFDSTGEELPQVTQVVIGMSDFMVNNGLGILLGLISIIVFLYFFKKTDTGNYMMDNAKLHMPIFGKLLQKGYLSRFSRSLGNLVDSKISIVRALEITANSIGNEVYRRKLMLSMEDIKQGIPLAENLSSSSLFPPMLVSMIDVGEQTAQLDEITKKVAKFYEDEVDTAVNSISKLIEPIIIVTIGLSVFAVVAAVMLPLIQLSNITSSF